MGADALPLLMPSDVQSTGFSLSTLRKREAARSPDQPGHPIDALPCRSGPRSGRAQTADHFVELRLRQIEKQTLAVDSEAFDRNPDD